MIVATLSLVPALTGGCGFCSRRGTVSMKRLRRYGFESSWQQRQRREHEAAQSLWLRVVVATAAASCKRGARVDSPGAFSGDHRRAPHSRQ